METALSDIQILYNKELARFKKAWAYMDGDISDADRNKWLSEFKKIRKKLGILVDQIGDMTDEEISEGFR